MRSQTPLTIMAKIIMWDILIGMYTRRMLTINYIMMKTLIENSDHLK